jgi:two-component system, OmpR family, sensor histidine kinase MtrB
VTVQAAGPRPAGRRLGLRTRVALVGAGLAAAIAGTLSLITVITVRSYLLEQRENAALAEASANARTVRDLAVSGRQNLDEILRGLRSEPGSIILVRSGGEWFSSSIGTGPDALPPSLLEALDDASASRMRFATAGTARLAVALPLPAAGLDYVEVFPLERIDSTLTRLSTVLAIGALLLSAAGAGVATWTSRRVLAPLSATSRAAALLASGDLDARLAPDPDPDLARLVAAFNDMAAALGERIAREARFTSDVSHELRTPVAAMRSAANVLGRRRQELSEVAAEALDLLSHEIDEFDQLVSDLLEMSRLEAGVDGTVTEEVKLLDVLGRLARQAGCSDVSIESVPEPPEASDPGTETVWVDKRRLERVVSNLLRNAAVHGGGAVRVAVIGEVPHLRIEVDDAGPGVPVDERQRIFERFARSDDARQRPGSGLGLSIAAEHARHLDGHLEVTDRPGGGARFQLWFRVARA